MAHASWSEANPEPSPVRWRARRHVAARIAAAMVLLASLWGPTVAQAQIRVVPDARGYIGASLIAGPVPAKRLLRLADRPILPTLHQALPEIPGIGWRLISVSDGPFDFEHETPLGDAMLLGGALVADRELDAILLVSVDGSARILLDGKSLWQTDSVRCFARSKDLVPLRLDRGEHTLLIALERQGKPWKYELRLLDPNTFLPPAGLHYVLPGTGEAEGRRLQKSMLSIEIRAGLGRSGYRPSVTAAYRRGVPQPSDLTTTIDFASVKQGRSALVRRAGALSQTTRAVYPLTVQLPELPVQEDERLMLRVRVGAGEATGSILVSLKVTQALRAAHRQRSRLLEGLGPRVSDPGVLRATIDHRLMMLEEATNNGSGSFGPVGAALGKLQELITHLEQGKDPLHQPGVLELARFSDLDGLPDPLLVHVPRDYDRNAGRRYPLVVALHGLNGSPQRILQAFLDSTSGQAVRKVDGFVAAPHAHGNSFYRGAGEHAVLDALEWLEKTFPIDPGRVSITGVSMGGTGAAELALRHSERFAAAAPLCGYHSFFLRRDVRGQPLRSWESARMQHWSPAFWAENGHALPMFVAHGLQDLPLANSKVLVDRYVSLGYDLATEWPAIGHDVWRISYSQAKLWGWLTSRRKDPVSQSVTVKTDTLRYGRQAWIEVTALERPGEMGIVRARFVSPDRVEIRTEGIAGFRILRDRSPCPHGQSLNVSVDGTDLSYGMAEFPTARRVEGSWAKQPGRLPGEKTTGLEGPIRDIFSGPLVFVYGAISPRTRRANREIAEAASALGFGGAVRYPVIADTELTPTIERTTSIFVIGSPDDTEILGRVGRQLPFWVDADRICSRSGCFSGPEIGALFIYPNPRAHQRYIAVLTAPRPEGLFRALSLPRLLPDFVVYDHDVAPAAGRQVLGSAHVLAAGFFRRDWSLPDGLEESDRTAMPNSGSEY